MKKTLFLINTSFLLTACVTAPLAELDSFTSAQVCNMLSEEIIEATLGTPATTEAKKDIESPFVGACQWFSTDNAKPQFTKNINVTIRSSSNETQIKSDYDRAKVVWSNNPNSQREERDVESIGTEAHWSFASAVPQLITYQNNRLLIVTLGQLNEEDEIQLKKAGDIANHILGQVVN